MISRYIARQFSRPTGVIGRAIGRGMAKRNVREARWTVELLAIEPESHVLEIALDPLWRFSLRSRVRDSLHLLLA